LAALVAADKIRPARHRARVAEQVPHGAPAGCSSAQWQRALQKCGFAAQLLIPTEKENA
jgi:hypothetical protein